jgi:hypothetical protein
VELLFCIPESRKLGKTNWTRTKNFVKQKTIEGHGEGGQNTGSRKATFLSELQKA